MLKTMFRSKNKNSDFVIDASFESAGAGVDYLLGYDFADDYIYEF